MLTRLVLNKYFLIFLRIAVEFLLWGLIEMHTIYAMSLLG